MLAFNVVFGNTDGPAPHLAPAGLISALAGLISAPAGPILCLAPAGASLLLSGPISCLRRPVRSRVWGCFCSAPLSYFKNNRACSAVRLPTVFAMVRAFALTSSFGSGNSTGRSTAERRSCAGSKLTALQKKTSTQTLHCAVRMQSPRVSPRSAVHLEQMWKEVKRRLGKI